MKRILDETPNAREVYEYDEDQERILVHHEEDPDRFLDHNKRVSAEWDGWNQDKTRRLVARIPDTVIYTWLLKYGVNIFNKDHQDAVSRLLNDPDYRYLRISDIIL